MSNQWSACKGTCTATSETCTATSGTCTATYGTSTGTCTATSGTRTATSGTSTATSGTFVPELPGHYRYKNRKLRYIQVQVAAHIPVFLRYSSGMYRKIDSPFFLWSDTNDRSYIVEDFFNTPLGSKPAAFSSPGVGEKRDLTFDTTILQIVWRESKISV